MVASNSVAEAEWAGAVDDALPSDRLVIEINVISEEGRLVEFILMAKNLMNFLGKK